VKYRRIIKVLEKFIGSKKIYEEIQIYSYKEKILPEFLEEGLKSGKIKVISGFFSYLLCFKIETLKYLVGKLDYDKILPYIITLKDQKCRKTLIEGLKSVC